MNKYGKAPNQGHFELSFELSQLDVGDKIYFPNKKQGFEIKAINADYLIATRPHFDSFLYTIVNFAECWCAPDDRVFSKGYETQEDIDERMKELVNGDIDLSTRHGKLIDFDGYKKKDERKIKWFEGSCRG